MFSQVGKLSPAFSPMAAVRGRRNAHSHPLVRLARRTLQLIQGSLRVKFIVVIVSLEIALMGAVFLVVERNQRRGILEQSRLRALSLGSSLAALSEGYLVTYNFIKLEQVAEKLTAEEEDVVYAAAHLRDGRVAAFSGRSDLQGRMLDDPVSHRALQTAAALVQPIVIPQTAAPGYDVAIPVYVPGVAQRWGTIRVGFSLTRAYAAIEDTRRDLFLLSLIAIVCGMGLAGLLATRISRPIGQLVAEVHELSRGSYDHSISVDAKDEIGYLAQAFEQMRKSVQIHLTGLAEEKQLLEESNNRLEDTQQQLLHLAARVAHEVNNPLAIIKTAIRIINKQSQTGEHVNGNLRMIEEEINRIARIIREILAFSRPRDTNEVVEMNTVILSLESLLRQSLDEKEIALSVTLAPELPRVRISSDHLKQVVLNMVRNAEDAMAAGGHLAIQTAMNGKGVVLSIADSGCGIPQEHLGRLFDPFFTTKDKEAERGMGLGLAVSYGIIRGASGSIDVETEVGKGSTFRIHLPTCAA